MVQFSLHVSRVSRVAHFTGYASPLSLTFRVRERAALYADGGPVADTTSASSESDPVPDPFDDADALGELEEEIVFLSAHIHAATWRLLILVAEFDRRRGWELEGHSTCGHWLAMRTGLDLGAARERVRVARALTALPLIGAAMSRGELSFSAVRALTRVATPENEEALVELARGCTVSQLERMVRAFRLGSRESEAERERRRHRSRYLSIFPHDDGMYVIRARVMPEVGALFMRTIEAAEDALYREKGPPELAGDMRVSREMSRQEASRRRADAFTLVAERAMAAGFGGSGENAEEGEEAETGSGAGSPLPLSGRGAERYQVLLHVDMESLKAEGEPGRSELEDGTRVSAETSRRIACAAAVVAIHHDTDGAVIGAGRRTRTIAPAVRRALEARDRGCRFPGCGLRFTDAHHVKHWADGGETTLANLLLLCSYHHRLVHEEGWTVQWWGKGRPAFIDPSDRIHFTAGWKVPELPPDPVAALVEENRRLGVNPDWFTAAGARWKREWDIPDHIYYAAMEAISEKG